ncbi:MAG TPA: hypothetical protein H9881_05525 [Candidatus Stackebrandtia excrementipullorum]|nr:hypothetical protein [Candidatus Stackebrandtia excrementipullorum]
MQISEHEVRNLGARIRTVGQDAESYVHSMSKNLCQGCTGNDGFASVSTLRQTLERLEHLAGNLALESQRTADRVVLAAGNHAMNDGRQAQNFGAFTHQLSGRG